MDLKSGGELPFDFRESLDSKRVPMPLKSASPDSDSPMIHQGKQISNTYAELRDVNTPPDMSVRVFMNYRMDIKTTAMYVWVLRRVLSFLKFYH